jgi:3-oxoacyl-[acyl-carrier-protein] synthase II
MALHRSVMPPTANFKTRDPDCDLDYVVEGAREKSMRYVLSNSFGFGGTNGSLLFKKYQPS